MPVCNSRDLLQRWVQLSIILREDWDAVPVARRASLERCDNVIELVNRLVEEKLLTDYQASRITIGKTYGLVLGNYRVLERIGAGGMGVVYKAEHVRMRRLAAVKVLALHIEENQDPQLLTRFYTEMRAVARLHHPNIVSAVDAGEVRSPNPELPVLHYYVMEYVPGRDLEDHIAVNGRLPFTQASDLAYQVASALAEAHKHELVHRDIKPANILMTPDGQAKLLDFGLARHFNRRMTEPGTVLGTVDYMAPEQVRDSSNVDIRADIYSLGGTLFWCLCGEVPFPQAGDVEDQLRARLTQPPPSLLTRTADVPPGLDAVVRRMMALDPAERYPTPEAVKNALLPFLHPTGRTSTPPNGSGRTTAATEHLQTRETINLPPPPHRILLVDDQPEIHAVCGYALQAEGYAWEGVKNGYEALAAIEARPFDLVLLDVDIPGMNGFEVLRRLRPHASDPNLKVLMVSGRATADEMATMLQAGADDYLTKPFSLVQLRARVKAALQLKQAQDRSATLLRHQAAVAAELERGLSTRDSALDHARTALVSILARTIEQSQVETPGHLIRMQRYVQVLASEAGRVKIGAGTLTTDFIKALEDCVPLHDIGKLALPEHIRLKPGKLTPEERLLMQEHATLGAESLQAAAQRHGSALPFLPLALEVVRHHHERWDGQGYPDGLAGDAIPLAARLTALADVYDALRTRQSYKPALPHSAAVQLIASGSEGHFDPALVEIFRRCAPAWEAIYREVPDRATR
jgi:response regulator RpfG family c-di-GMP phosphodiesterase/serine/threonine protein kinase